MRPIAPSRQSGRQKECFRDRRRCRFVAVDSRGKMVSRRLASRAEDGASAQRGKSAKTEEAQVLQHKLESSPWAGGFRGRESRRFGRSVRRVVSPFELGRTCPLPSTRKAWLSGVSAKAARGHRQEKEGASAERHRAVSFLLADFRSPQIALNLSTCKLLRFKHAM
jgi:hypothetical protein